jgi:septal ring factor EnvC (AmiA/AmiB activator)
MAGQELDASRRNLGEVQRRIQETAKDLDAKKAAARSLADDLNTVEKEMERIGERLDGLLRKVSALQRDVAGKEQEVEDIRKAVAGLEGKVRKRLAALYKSGEMGFLRVLFGTDSPARRAEDFDYLGRVVRRDRELLLTYRRQLGELETTLRQLADLRRQHQSALTAQRGEQETLRRAAALKQKLLVEVRRDEAALSAKLEDMRQRAARMADLVKKLERESAPEYTEKPGLFAAQKGRLPWPAAGAVKVGFGTGRHPELGTLYDSQGLEIAMKPEEPIAAVWPGRVIFANRFQGYGNLLIVDHGESYYTLYAQASRLLKKIGDPVAQGETLALSGFDGGDSCYFEIRHRGTPLDPGVWLAPHR